MTSPDRSAGIRHTRLRIKRRPTLATSLSITDSGGFELGCYFELIPLRRGAQSFFAR